jgi:hypothetical protein
VLDTAKTETNPWLAQVFFPPIDPYVAAAGYNMLVQVVYTRIVRYLNDTLISQLSDVYVNGTQLLAAVKAATATTFVSPWLKSVQDGTAPTGSVGVKCQLSVFAVNPGTAGQISISVSAIFSGYIFSAEGLQPYIIIKETPLGDFGPLILQLLAPISANPDAANATATITADFADASVLINETASSSDALWFAGTTVGQTIVNEIKEQLTAASTIELIPPLSPFGDLTGSNVFDTFLVDVFPTTNPPNYAEGLSIGFRLRSGAVASPNEVQSVAGLDEYGTVMDEYTVAQVLKDRWPQGYLQKLNFSGTTTVDLNDGNGPQPVEMWGTLALTSLDSVTIATGQSAGGEFDFIDLSGACTVTINQLKTLDNGQVQSVQKNNSFQSNWSFGAGVSPSPPVPTTPLPPAEQSFIDTASKRSVQYLARPLRGVTQTVTTSSLDGVAGFLYATGHF